MQGESACMRAKQAPQSRDQHITFFLYSIGLWSIIYRYLIIVFFASFPNLNWALPGDLDTSFGGAFGRYFINIFPNEHDGATAITRQPDGKLIMAGTCFSGDLAQFCVVRRNVDGSADSSFGSNAFNIPGAMLFAVSSGIDEPSAIALQPDGKIIIAGTCIAFNIRSFCFLRMTPNGFADPSFGASGRVNQIVGAGDAAVRAVLIQPDGKYVLAGTCFDGTYNTLCAARFLSTGAFDNSFGVQGRRFFPVTADARGFAAALRSDGRILIAGSCNNGGSTCVGRLTASGAVDSSFTQTDEEIPTNGIAIASNGGNDRAGGLALQADGKIVLGGTCPLNNQPAFCATRLDANGFPDNTFGVVGAPDRVVRFSLNTSNAVASTVLLQNDGRIVLTGSCVGTNSDFCILRLNDNGSADQSFGSFGVVKTNVIDAADFGNAALIQPDGKIVVAGQCAESSAPSDAAMCIARYEGGPFSARQCSFDVDGDGVVLGTTDQLILSRMARGAKDASAIGGITFAPHAARKTWDAIRTYLVAQCGSALP